MSLVSRAQESLIARRPEGLIYGLADVPGLLPLVALGLQHFLVVAPNLAVVLLICRVAGIDAQATENVLSLSLIALGAATILQCSPRFGSGYFITSCTSGIYLSASVSAAAGGLPVVCGMTLLAGIFQTFFASALVRLRRFFPNEIVGLSIIIVGIELGAIGLNRLPEAGALGVLAGTATFFVSVLFGVFGKSSARLYCSLFGMACGYALCVAFGVRGPGAGTEQPSSVLFVFPSLAHLRLEFDIAFLLPFAFTAMAASLKTMGAVVTCARINDSAWVRPDMHRVKRGVIADGLGTIASALLGGAGTNSATSSVGVSRATGATSRMIGIAVAGWMFLFALSPDFTRLVVTMPDPVVGGALVFAGCLVMANGFEILGTVPMDMRRAGVVAFPLMLAISRIADAPLFFQLPEPVRPMFSSALAIGVFAALVVNAFLSWGSARRARLFLDPLMPIGDRIAQVRSVLDGWQVAHNVKVRLMLTLRELLDERGCDLQLAFDGCTLRVGLTRDEVARDAAKLSDGRFFTDRVSDGISYRKRLNGTSHISATFEQ